MQIQAFGGVADVVPVCACVCACIQVMMQNKGALIVKYCDAFGFPDHILQAPIAFDWTKDTTTTRALY